MPRSSAWIFQPMPKPRQPRSGIRPARRQGGHEMRTYNTQHAYYCGVDLHARSLFVNVLDDKGATRLEQDLPASPAAFLDAVKPYRDGLVVGCECMFAWYWLADLCERERIPFVLGHALAMKAIHGGKAKNDRLDAAEDRRPAQGRVLPDGLRLPQGQARDPRPAPPPLVLRPPAGPVDRPHPEHELASTTCRRSTRSSPTRATASAAIADRFEHPSTQLSHHRRPRPDRELRHPDRRPRDATW